MWHYLDIPTIIFEENAIVAVGFYELNNEKIIILRKMNFYNNVFWLALIKRPNKNSENITIESKNLDLLKLKSLIIASEIGWSIKKIL